MNGACNGTFFVRSLGPWGGAKRSNIVKFQLQSQFQRTLNQTLYVFDIKHIRRDFHSVAWVMAQGWDLGKLGGQIRSFVRHAISSLTMGKIQLNLVCELLT